MSCAKDTTLLERYVDDELPDILVRRVETALETCPHCRLIVDEHLSLRKVLRDDISAAVSAASFGGLWDRIEPELEAPLASKPSLMDRAREWWENRRLEAALGFGVALATVAVLVWVGTATLGHQVAAGDLADASNGDNTLIIESYEVKEGTVVIDVDPDDPTAPAVVWHFVDDEQDEQG
ncbi:MAG: anti-sigma factor RsiW [Myxococcota bacterium]|jgi:anti-sigma factor RsiW